MVANGLVVVVSGNETWQETLATDLRQEHFVVRGFCDAFEVLERLRQITPAAIVLDVECEGAPLFHAVRQRHASLTAIPVFEGCSRSSRYVAAAEIRSAVEASR